MAQQSGGASGSGSFALEALGGSVGSALGMIIVGVSADCDVEDLACLIKTIAGAGALGVVGATAGTILVARRNGSPRSVVGAAAGAMVGTGVALGVHWLLDNNSDRNLDDAEFVIPLFAIGQGTFAALGSRLAGN